MPSNRVGTCIAVTCLTAQMQNKQPPAESGGGLPFGIGITVISMRLDFDPSKSAELSANAQRGIGFEDAREVFERPYYQDQRSDLPEQHRAIGALRRAVGPALNQVFARRAIAQ